MYIAHKTDGAVCLVSGELVPGARPSLPRSPEPRPARENALGCSLPLLLCRSHASVVFVRFPWGLLYLVAQASTKFQSYFCV